MKFGLNHPYDPHEAPRLRLAPFVMRDEFDVPTMVDYITSVPGPWPMYLNDQKGDCGPAACGHAITATQWWGQGQVVRVTDDDVEKTYEDVGGYNPDDPSTDNGVVLQDLLDYWRREGIGDHRILAFASVDIMSPTEMMYALNTFGHLLIGMAVPASAEQQFAHNQIWDTVSTDGGIVGGHAVNVGFMDMVTGKREFVTWGSVASMTRNFWERYGWEAWVVIDDAWVNIHSGQSPTGLNTAGLNDAFTKLTGQPGPFPSGPASDVDADLAMAFMKDNWVLRRHYGDTHRVAERGLAWLQANGYTGK